MRREIAALPGLCKALALAVENGDDVALSTALAARGEAFAELAQREPDADERALLRQVARGDLRLLELAREAQQRLRTELLELAQLRAAAQSAPRSDPGMRFVSQRV